MTTDVRRPRFRRQKSSEWPLALHCCCSRLPLCRIPPLFGLECPLYQMPLEYPQPPPTLSWCLTRLPVRLRNYKQARAMRFCSGTKEARYGFDPHRACPPASAPLCPSARAPAAANAAALLQLQHGAASALLFLLPSAMIASFGALRPRVSPCPISYPDKGKISPKAVLPDSLRLPFAMLVPLFGRLAAGCTELRRGPQRIWDVIVCGVPSI